MPADKTADCKLLQDSKALFPTVVTLSGITIPVKPWQLEKALEPISSRPFGSTILISGNVALSKTEEPIDFKFAESVMLVI